MVEQRVDERAARMPRRRVDDEARGLVDDDQVLVLEDDRERDVLGFGRRIERRRHLEEDAHARLHLQAEVRCDRAVERHETGCHELLQARARQREILARRMKRQRLIEPDPRLVLADREDGDLRSVHVFAHAANSLRR